MEGMRDRLSQMRLDILLVAVVIVLSMAAMTWNIKVKQAPARVFWGAMANSLTTEGVKCHIGLVDDTSATDQVIEVNLEDKLNARRVTNIERGTNSVTTEEVATKTADYIRYTEIKTTQKNTAGKPLDFSKVLNVWGKNPGTSTLYTQMALGTCIMPLAHLSSSQAQPFIATLNQGKIFQTDLNKSSRATYHGLAVRVYDVKVQPLPYLAFMQQLGKQLDIHDLDKVSPSTYAKTKSADSADIMDANAHQVLEIDYADGKHTITFRSYGKQPTISLPTKSVTADELQKRFVSAN